ncbi:MAG TPA: aminoacyl-tRNA hydrolase [Vicinamibacterales bacterium]|nr:aminoacyl-tRNA hydrolase [Vicinamibacterales bacterium]
MKLVVGLGNPGGRYRGTRHNVGFEVVDGLVARHGLTLQPWKTLAETAEWRRPEGRVWFVKPTTFMNLSGEAVVALMGFYKVELPDVLVVCDDVNLPVGRLRARPEGSGGGNNGLGSIIGSLGTDGFSRIRIGVGRGDPQRDLADHVLSRFPPEDLPVMTASLERAGEAVEVWIDEGIARVMNKFNRADDGSTEPRGFSPGDS